MAMDILHLHQLKRNKNMKKILFLLVCTIMSCDSAQKKEVDKNLITPSSEKVNIVKDSVIIKDSLTCFKIALFNPNYKIINAYYDCGIKRERQFNSEKINIDDCSKKLVVENDTVKMYVTYAKTGNFKFEDITVLVKDNTDKFSFIDTTFSFTVSDL
jgi:hypothetical protein